MSSYAKNSDICENRRVVSDPARCEIIKDGFIHFIFN